MGGKESKPQKDSKKLKKTKIKGSVLESEQIRDMYKKVLLKNNHKYMKQFQKNSNDHTSEYTAIRNKIREPRPSQEGDEYQVG